MLMWLPLFKDLLVIIRAMLRFVEYAKWSPILLYSMFTLSLVVVISLMLMHEV